MRSRHSLLVLCSLSAMLTGLSQSGFAQSAADSVTEKFINVEAPRWQALELKVMGLQHCASASEPQQVRFSANKAFYLGAYWRDQAGNAKMLLQPQATPFDATREHSLRFNVDQAGAYELVLVATSEPLALEPALVTANSNAQIVQAFARLGIDIDADPAPQNAANTKATTRQDVQVQRYPFEVLATPAQTTPPAPQRYSAFSSDAPLAFVQLDRSSYRLGEPFRLIYGATAAGYVQIFLQQPNGSTEVLLSQAIEAEHIYQAAGKAVEPLGTQALLISYSRQPPSATDLTPRGLALDTPLPANTALFPFVIVE